MNNIQEKLFELRDEKYKEFHTKLLPGIAQDTIIGVRTPELRRLIKDLDSNEINIFLMSSLPHDYYEENNLHVFLISQIKDYDICIENINRFLPFVNNWATCDSLRPACFKKNKQKLLKDINKWIVSKETYTVRFAIEMLMVHFLDEDFNEKYITQVCEIKSDEYYVNMMIAWFLATALAKQYETAVKVLENRVLTAWIHNKTIQKAIESFRITNNKKDYLKSLKIT